MPEKQAVNPSDILKIVTLITEEARNFIGSSNKREHFIVRCEELFDVYLAPIDLPGPDRIIDPLIRSAIRPVAGRLYDEILKKINS